jgi:hypothetical protein
MGTDITALVERLDARLTTPESIRSSIKLLAGRPRSAALPSAVFATLARHDVRFVLIGGVAAIVRGWEGITPDVDIVPDERYDNLQRLSDAFQDLVRQRSAELAAALAGNVSGRTWNLLSDLGLDIMFHPDGAGGYDELRRNATVFTIRSWGVYVASLDDLIRAKQTSARTKDVAIVPDLVSLRQRSRASQGR